MNSFQAQKSSLVSQYCSFPSRPDPANPNPTDSLLGVIEFLLGVRLLRVQDLRDVEPMFQAQQRRDRLLSDSLARIAQSQS